MPNVQIDPLQAPQLWIAEGRMAALAHAARLRLAEAPDDWVARYILAAALLAGGEAEAGARALDQARLLQALIVLQEAGVDLEALRRDGASAASMGAQLYARGFVALAEVAFEAATRAGCPDRAAWLSLALSRQHQGRVEEAIAAFRDAAARWPTPAVEQFLLPALFAADDGVARQAAEARRWAARHAPSVTAPAFRNACADGRPLRIGYVAPRFTTSQLRQFMAPLFDHHDSTAVQVFVYPEASEVMDGFACPVIVHPIGAMSDQAASECIRGDRIDVLIDCWGHNAGSRTSVFALRPAPVQVSWLNYQHTTGIEAFDYVLQTDYADCPEMEARFVERIWRMGDACGAFRPDTGPLTSPAPCLKSGRATFGAFVHPSRLSQRTVALWASILRGAPGSRLVLKYSYFVDPVLQMATRVRFLAHGVDPGRIECRGRTEGSAYHAEFADIDLALDPTPYVGGTTSMEALSRGVPVLTLAGETYYSRLGASVVAPAGLADMVVTSEAAYVGAAIRLAADPQAMQALRERVPAGFAAASYRDEAGMARRLEAVYRAMYARWSERSAAA